MKKSVRVETVENGSFVIRENEATVRYSRKIVEKMIAQLENDLRVWKERLAKIDGAGVE